MLESSNLHRSFHSQINISAKESPCSFVTGKITTTVISSDAFIVNWRISEARLRMVASYLPADADPIRSGLRIYDATDYFAQGTEPLPCLDVTLTVEEQEVVVESLCPGRTYLVDFGLFHGRQFCPILRSDFLVLPRDGKRTGAEERVSSRRASRCRNSLPYQEHPVLLA
ncbi:DUF4912 domain-containing protein [Brevibacillus ruminantium]|uniref:DUF4912 domain-containing protein n=1 Tax=Brevibacillus ruminantium TaxID=2950604 RepID=A0ABY4WSM5_9BACL|nr:DUF4912 domain-containing protein [Brevibacillus ruminantium]USG67601.1 DUF4912 domain-containing protein [Brevibacillus ruminantium]